jgi:hypothetical protein
LASSKTGLPSGRGQQGGDRGVPEAAQSLAAFALILNYKAHFRAH